MNSTREVIGACAECGGRVLWLPLFGKARDLGACERCNEWRYFHPAPPKDAAMSAAAREGE